MDDIIAYIVLFVVGFTVIYAYRWKRTKRRDLPLSIQNYADAILRCSVYKQQGKIIELRLSLSAKSSLKPVKLNIELLDNKRKITLVELPNSTKHMENVILKPGENHVFHFQLISLIKLLNNQPKKIGSFRIAIENDKGKKYKTHELAFNKNWSIYRPDSGKYN